MNYEITQDITKLFEAFDHDRDQEISAKEIFKTMQSMGYDLDLAEAERMIASKSAKKTLGPQEFHSLMQPIMLDHIFSSEN
jgi:Ca2+-binding EF-hand superfamily protein